MSPVVGRLLQQILEPDSRMGLAYERAVGFFKGPHSHPRLMIVCPRGACRMEVFTGNETFVIDSTRVLIVPKGIEHSTQGLSEVYDAMALFPDEIFVEELIHENGLGDEERASLGTFQRARRSRWLDDIVNRYFFERVLNAKTPRGCTFFLEKQILNELARILFSDKFLRYGEPLGDHGNDVTSKALGFIEANLFEPLEISKISQATKASESTLLRSFKKELGQTPYAYIRNRRLDEAASLLRQGGYQVGDVSMLVGYEDFSAFSKAFKSRFGTSPAHFPED